MHEAQLLARTVIQDSSATKEKPGLVGHLYGGVRIPTDLV